MSFFRFERLVPGSLRLSLLLICGAIGLGESFAKTQVAISTPWDEAVTAENAWEEYPRPQFVRSDWRCLNGNWDYAIVGSSGEWDQGRIENEKSDLLEKSNPATPVLWDGKILVPFAPEVKLSGVERYVRPGQLLWYRRSFSIPENWEGKRILLNFEAVDWHCRVLVNGQEIGEHKGGYLPFSLDITEALDSESDQELVVVVWDPTNFGDQSIGKQALPENQVGYRYTPVSGIWQTVWMEAVDQAAHIEGVKLTPDIDRNQLQVASEISGNWTSVKVEVFDEGRAILRKNLSGDKNFLLQFDEKLDFWTPEHPKLYDLRLSLISNGEVVDVVQSYFAMRKISVGPNRKGEMQMLLNNEPIFQFGPLDQGYWPNSSLTPPSDEAAKWDVEYLKRIGCNMVRVHIKVHPRRWYTYCDRLGLLVWQDFVCSRKFDRNITEASASQWEKEQKGLIDHLYNTPSVIQWIVFNEKWGQYDTERLTRWTQSYDPTRVVSNSSGWEDHHCGDVFDEHDYTFTPCIALADSLGDRVSVLGEAGGHNVYLQTHMWDPARIDAPDSDWIRDNGRETYVSGSEWQPRYEAWIQQLRILREYGMGAAIYTQISDVEHECNGWLTYDRRVSKIPVGSLRAIHDKLFSEIERETLLGGGKSGKFRYSLQPASRDWIEPDSDDSAWKEVHYPASSSIDAASMLPEEPDESTSILLRWEFRLEQLPESTLAVRVAGIAKYEFFLNGEKIKDLYNDLHLAADGRSYCPGSAFVLNPEYTKLLKPGSNVLAVKIDANTTKRGFEINQAYLAELPRLADIEFFEIKN